MPVTQYGYAVNGGYSNEIQNAPGAPFITNAGQAPTALGAAATPHLERFIFNKIMGTDPEPYFASLRLFMFGQTPVEVPLDQYEWSEKPSQRYALNANNGTADPVGTQIVAAIGGATGAYQQYNIPIPDSDLPFVALNNDIMFGNQGYGTIIAKTPGTPSTITVQSLVSAGLPAVLQGDRLPMMGEIRADGMETIVNVQRMSTVERYNYVATFMRSTKWARKELLNWQNGGTTDFIEKNQQEVILNLKYDALVNFWAGKKEMRLLSTGDYAKGMDGIDPQMRAGGSATATTTLGNLIATFEAMGQNTNYQARSGTRYVFARQELLTILSKEYKSLQTRYSPNDMVANMDLDKIKFGGQNYVLVPVEPFGDINYFQSDWADRMYVIDTGCVQTIKQKGLPFMDINNMMENHLQSFRDNPRSLRDYKVWSAEINISLKMVEPRGSYVINVI